MSRHPDIVLLVLDTQRADRLSCYGHSSATSPYLDALAGDATFFRHAIAPAQWTIPAHASMFTGVYPSRHHTHQSDAVLPETLTTLAERLRTGGFFTAGFCNNPLVGVVNNGLRRGFYSFLNYSGLMTSRPNQAGTHSNLFDRYRQLFKRCLAALLNRAQDAFARSDLLLALSFTPMVVPLWQTALSFKGNTSRSLHDAAQLLVERRGVERDQSVFCFINLMGAHMPYRPPRRFVEQFAPHVLRDKTARTYLRRFNSDIYGWLAPLNSAINAEQKATLDGMYDAEVANQDVHVGAFIDKLRSSGRLEHTLLIICADHGDHLGEKQMMGHGFSLYNELVHVPLIIRDPDGDFPRGTVVERFVSTRRLFNTVLTAAGMADEPERTLTLAQSATGDPDAGTVFAEALPPQNALRMIRRRQPDLIQARDCDQIRRAVCSDRHKLIQTGEHRLELYSMVEDPGETLNLEAILPERVEALQEQLQQFVAQAPTTPPPDTRTASHDDPEVQRRLRDLGYLE